MSRNEKADLTAEQTIYSSSIETVYIFSKDDLKKEANKKNYAT